MEKIFFRQAEPAETDEIFQIFCLATACLNSQNIYQWDDIYPDRQTILNDTKSGCMTAGTLEGKIAAVYVLNKESDSQYLNGAWRCSSENFMVVHRLCVSPAFQNRGIGALMLWHIERTLKKAGVKAIRLDAFSQNPHSIRLYEKAGFQTVGSAVFRKGNFLLMEKVLD